MRMIDRRAFLKRQVLLSGSACLALGAEFTASAQLAKSPLGRFKLGAISDGFSQDFEQALQIIKSYGLAWVEIRNVYGVYNTEASVAQIRRLKELLDQYHFRVSVIDSALYKCALPGAPPVKSQRDLYAYRDQMDLLKRACDRAHALGADKIRGFTFWRVATPELISSRIAEELGNASDVAKRAGMRLVIENEESCNAATGRELAAILSLAPAVNLGINWDVGNGYSRGEASFPGGYEALDKRRIWHMHLKGIQCRTAFENCSESFVDRSQIDLSGHFRRLLKDGYRETMSLECEFKARGLSHLETSKRSLESLLRIMAASTGPDPG